MATVTTATNGAVQGEPPAAAPAESRDALTDKQLAKAVLAREFKPRVGEVRRLAEAVLGKSASKAGKKQKRKGKKAKSGKLAKIPRQKS